MFWPNSPGEGGRIALLSGKHSGVRQTADLCPPHGLAEAVDGPTGVAAKGVPVADGRYDEAVEGAAAGRDSVGGGEEGAVTVPLHGGGRRPGVDGTGHLHLGNLGCNKKCAKLLFFCSITNRFWFLNSDIFSTFWFFLAIMTYLTRKRFC
jgi:hypothetical protein